MPHSPYSKSNVSSVCLTVVMLVFFVELFSVTFTITIWAIQPSLFTLLIKQPGAMLCKLMMACKSQEIQV